MPRERRNVLGWKTLDDGSVGIVVAGADGRPRGGPILDYAHDMRDLQFNGNIMRPQFAARVIELVRPNSVLENVGFANLNMEHLDVRGTRARGVEFCDCVLRDIDARPDASPTVWDSVSLVRCDLTGGNLSGIQVTGDPSVGRFGKSAMIDCALQNLDMRGMRASDMRIEGGSADHLSLAGATFSNRSRVEVEGDYMDVSNVVVLTQSNLHLAGNSRDTANLQGARAEADGRITSRDMAIPPVPEPAEDATFAMLEDVSVRYSSQLRDHFQVRVPIGNPRIPAHFLTITTPTRNVWAQGIGNHVPCGMVENRGLYEAVIDHAGLGHVSVPVRASMLEGIRTGRDDAYLADQLDAMVERRRQAPPVYPTQAVAPSFRANVRQASDDHGYGMR